MQCCMASKGSFEELEASGSVRDYVKAFYSLMLDVFNMSEEDNLFNFLTNLQP